MQDLYELVTVSRDAVFLEIRFQKTAPIQTSVESPHIHWETGKVSWMRLNDQPGDLPLRSTGTKVQATRNWQYEMDHRTVCGIIQFYFRCLRFLTEAFFGYIFGRS